MTQVSHQITISEAPLFQETEKDFSQSGADPQQAMCQVIENSVGL